ncbi:hypothetical protein ACQ86N_13345 [Puia sp. P3]|uniref:hypothetical protein n=1 Tax=Puia sp. P3 TaxID=3423952 RepID=UPI003D6674B5
MYNVGELQTSLINADKNLQNYLNGVKADSVKVDSTGKPIVDTAKKDTAANLANQNPLFRLMPPMQPQQDAKGQTQFPSAIARALIRDTGTINTYLSLPVIRNQFPRTSNSSGVNRTSTTTASPSPSSTFTPSAPFPERTRQGSKASPSRMRVRTSTPTPVR